MRSRAPIPCVGVMLQAIRFALLAIAFLLAPATSAQEGPPNPDPEDELFEQDADRLADGQNLDDQDLFGEADDDLFAEEEATVQDGLESPPGEGDGRPGQGQPLGTAEDGESAEREALTPPFVSGPSSGIEEIIVQGERGLAIETDAAQSVTVFDAADLRAMGVENVSDVAQFTPNLEIRTAGSTTATFFIRGVGLNDFTANGSGAVAIYQDDVALNLPAFQLGQIFDTQNISVEKGPLGSGPGRNASAGAIRIFSRKPEGEPSAFLRVDYGNHQYIDAEGALEVPLAPELLSVRGAFRLTRRQGLVDNRCADLTQAEIDTRTGECRQTTPSPGAPLRTGLPDKLNNIDTWAARTNLRLVPPDSDTEWLFNVHYGRTDQEGFVGEHLGTSGERLGSTDESSYQAPEVRREQLRVAARFPEPPGISVCRPPRGDPNSPECIERNQILGDRDGALGRQLAERPLDQRPFEGDYNSPGHERQETLGGYLRGEWVSDSVTLLSVTGAERYERDRMIDADYSPNRLFEFVINDDAWQVTQDLRATGELSTLPLSWGAGAFALIEELDFRQITLAAPTIFGIDQEFTQETQSVGVYGEFSWEFLDDFELSGGVRYNWERKRIDADIETQQTPVCEPVGLSIPVCVETASFDSPTGTISLEYFFDEETSVSWKYSRGWKGAQFNTRDGTVSGELIDIADPEKIDAFEVGLAGAWFDGRLNLDGALFWYSYEDYQVFQFTNDVGTPPQRIVLNADDAQLYGGELEARAEPIDGLVANVRVGWLESKFLNFSDTGARAVPGPDMFSTVLLQQTVDFTGNRFPNAPRFKASGSIEYTLELDRFGALIPRYDFSWTDDVFFDSSEGQGAPGLFVPSFLPDYTIAQRAYVLHNFRLTYRNPSGDFELSGWVRNLTDERYKTLSFDASQSVKLVGNLVGDPRTFGLSVTVSF